MFYASWYPSGLGALNALIQAGADISTRDAKSQTPLHHAAIRGHSDLIKTLVKNGAEVDSVDQDEMTALHYTSLFGHVQSSKAGFIFEQTNTQHKNN